MGEFHYGDTRIPYHVDGTRVFFKLADNTYPSRQLGHVEMTYLQTSYLNSDRLFSVLPIYLGTPNSNPYLGDVGVEVISFFFEKPMSITGVWMGMVQFSGTVSTQIDVSSDTTALDDGTWTRVRFEGVSTIQNVDSPYQSQDEINSFVSVRMSEPTTKVSSGRNNDFNAFQDVAWDKPLAAFTNYEDYSLGIIPSYGNEWRNVKAMRFSGLKDYSTVHLYGRPTDPNDAGMTFVRENGEPIRPRDVSFDPVYLGSGDHVLAPLRLWNSSDETMVRITLRVDATDDWKYVTANTGYSDLMTMVSVRIGGGAWVFPSVSGNKIEIPIPDLAPGELSDTIEIRATAPDAMPVNTPTRSSLILSTVLTQPIAGNPIAIVSGTATGEVLLSRPVTGTVALATTVSGAATNRPTQQASGRVDIALTVTGAVT